MNSFSFKQLLLSHFFMIRFIRSQINIFSPKIILFFFILIFIIRFIQYKFKRKRGKALKKMPRCFVERFFPINQLPCFQLRKNSKCRQRTRQVFAKNKGKHPQIRHFTTGQNKRGYRLKVFRQTS